MYAIARMLLGMLVSSIVVRLAVLLIRFHEHRGSRLVSRRAFLRNAVLGSVVVVGLEVLGGFVYFFWPNKTGAFGREITVPLDLVPPAGDAPYRNQTGKFYIITNDDGSLALYWKCTHLGCTVPWSPPEDMWHCPCHGSIYNRHGERVAGPAPRPLDLMLMRVEGNNVIVDTGTIIQRSQWEPDQSVQLSV